MIDRIKIPDFTKPEVDHREMFKECYVDVKKPVGKQPVAISIGATLYKGEFIPIPFGSYGDYSCIVGASKAKKTFLKSAIIAGYIGGNSNRYFPNIIGHRSDDKIVLDLDTEQSKYHSRIVFNRVCEMVGGVYERYFPFQLRGKSFKERYGFLEWLFNEWEYRNEIGLVSVDGYADLISNSNDLERSTELSNDFLKWTANSKAHLTGVLHRNFGSAKPAGHIGSTILKKAETIVFVETKKEQKNRSFVSCEYSRNLPFDDFCFDINDEWLPELVNESIFNE